MLTPLTFLLKKSINFTFVSVGKVIMSNTSRQSYRDKDKTEISVANEALFITAKQAHHCKVEKGSKSCRHQMSQRTKNRGVRRLQINIMNVFLFLFDLVQAAKTCQMSFICMLPK